jgi:hypothetical protein
MFNATFTIFMQQKLVLYSYCLPEGAIFIQTHVKLVMITTLRNYSRGRHEHQCCSHDRYKQRQLTFHVEPSSPACLRCSSPADPASCRCRSRRTIRSRTHQLDLHRCKRVSIYTYDKAYTMTQVMAKLMRYGHKKKLGTTIDRICETEGWRCGSYVSIYSKARRGD